MNTMAVDSVGLDERSDWPLSPVLDWLMGEGRHAVEPTRFTDALCDRLLKAGVPLWRLRFCFRTLHPQVAACAFLWTRERNATEFCLLHRCENDDVYTASLARPICGSDCATHERLAIVDPELHRLRLQGGIDYLVLPFVFSTGQRNALTVATARPGGFSQADLAKFEALASFLAPVLEVMAVRRISRTLLDTYLGPRSGGKVLAGMIRRGDAEAMEAVLWFSDLRDFTHLTETLPIERLLALLNAHFESVTTAIAEHGGEVLRYIGDATLAVFPVAAETHSREVCASALDAALAAFRDLSEFNRAHHQRGEPPIRFGIGLHLGRAIYGNVGAPERLDFTVMGAAVNRTARLEELTKSIGVPLLLSADFAARIERPLRSLGQYPMKGIPEPQEVFSLAYPPQEQADRKSCPA